MKGIVFNTLEEMVIDKTGLEGWDQLITSVELSSKGIYTAGKNYSDEEIVLLAQKASEMLNIPLGPLINAFGDFLFQKLARKYPVFIESQPEFFGFLKSVHDVIHVEVRKLYEEPSLPHFSYRQLSENVLLMEYRSPRKLCLLAEGLIAGAAAHYQVNYQLDHSSCLHKGDDHCLFRITREG